MGADAMSWPYSTESIHGGRVRTPFCPNFAFEDLESVRPEALDCEALDCEAFVLSESDLTLLSTDVDIFPGIGGGFEERRVRCCFSRADSGRRWFGSRLRLGARRLVCSARSRSCVDMFFGDGCDCLVGRLCGVSAADVKLRSGRLRLTRGHDEKLARGEVKKAKEMRVSRTEVDMGILIKEPKKSMSRY